MKIVKINSTENCHFYSREKSLYIAWACFRNEMATTSSSFYWKKSHWGYLDCFYRNVASVVLSLNSIG